MDARWTRSVSKVDSSGSRIKLGVAQVAPRQDWRASLPFFYGWFIVGASFVSLGLTYTVWYSFSVFYVALLEEFGWSRAASAGIFSLFVVVVGIASAGAGALADRFGPGKVVSVGVTILAAGLLACSRVEELWQFYLAFGVLAAVGVSASGWISCVTMVNRWFSARLGLALGIASAGIGVGILVMVPLTQVLISAVGWTTTFVALAAVIFAGVAPIALFVLRGRPEDLGLLRDGRRTAQGLQEKPPAAPAVRLSRIVDRAWAERSWTVGAAMRTRRYWFIGLMLYLNNTATQMVFVHQVAFLADGGYDKLLAASIVGLVGFFSVGAKVGWGWVSDRLGRELAWTMGLATLLLAIVVLILTRFVAFPALIYLFAVLFALGYGASAPLGPAVAADVFAGRHFGAVYGTILIANGLGSATGAWFAGYAFDLTGSYLFAFGCAAVSSLLSAGVVWVVGPSRVRRVAGRAK